MSQDFPNRKSTRLEFFDYTSENAYFVTICTYGRVPLFGEVVDNGILLNDAGKMVEQTWQQLCERFPFVELNEFVVMPNHIHGIVVLRRRGEPCVRPSAINSLRPTTINCGPPSKLPKGTDENSLGRVVQAFKSMAMHQYIQNVRLKKWAPFEHRIWQRNYHEHIIRNENDLNHIREYIINNPLQWSTDDENPLIKRD